MRSTSSNAFSSVSADFDSTERNRIDLLPSFHRASSSGLNISSFEFPGFTENRGQIADSSIYYYFMQETYMICFYESELRVFTRFRAKDPWEFISVTFPEAQHCIPYGVGKMIHISNYFNYDLAITGVPLWAEIYYENLYPGISLRFYSTSNAIKYEFIILPYIDPSVITLQINPLFPSNIEITPDHVLCTSRNIPNLILWDDWNPISMQDHTSRITTKFYQTGIDPWRYSFQIDNYEPSSPLIIDPIILLFSTYFGSTSRDYCFDIAVDHEGCSYITGSTYSSEFPLINGYSTTNQGNMDVYVAKFSANGQRLLYSTFLGGSENDEGIAIGTDTEGCIYITGSTFSNDFPTTNAIDPVYNGDEDAFLAKLSADGQNLLYSTYIGGWTVDHVKGMALDILGCAYITGRTESVDFPTVNALNLNLNGSSDAFVTKLTPDGQNMLYSTFLGGASSEEGRKLVVDTNNCVFVTGYTFSSDFPTINAYDSTYNNGGDVFLTRFTVDGQTLLYSTFLGGSSAESSRGLALDDNGCIYLMGTTMSSNFPIINAFNATITAIADYYVSKFAADGQSLVYSTFIGGSSFEFGKELVVDAAGCAYITGNSMSADFPTLNAISTRSPKKSHFDTIVVKFAADGRSLLYSTHLGGSNTDGGEAIAIDPHGFIYIAGYTESGDFPMINAFDETPHNVFITKLDFDSDGDGLSDCCERLVNSDPNDPSDADLDFDGDGINNRWECLMGLNATDSSDASLDFDDDGLTNFEEFERNSSPWKEDTDHDGWKDRMDLSPTNHFLPTFPLIGGGFLLISGIIVFFGLRNRKKQAIQISSPPPKSNESPLKK